MEKSKSRFYSPLRYPGGKACIFSFVADLLYRNNLIGVSYAEPYAGGAGLALRLLAEEYVSQISINDLDYAIYAFWYSVLNFPDEMCRWLQSVEVNMESWRYYKKINLEKEYHDILEVGKSTFFLNRTNVSGVIKGGVIGGQMQTGKYKINARFDVEGLICRIEFISKFRNRISLSNMDGKDFLSSLNGREDDMLIYLDPPYYQKGADLYMNYFRESDHADLLDVIRKVNHYWFASYDWCNFINSLYSDFRRIKYQISQCTSNRSGNEVIIFDDKIDFMGSFSLLRNSSILKS